MTCAAERRELGFERAHFRPENELAMVQNPPDRGVYGRTEPAALRGHVNKRDRRIGAQIHRTPEPGPSTDDDTGTFALRRRHHGRARREAARRDFKAGHRLLARHGRCIP